ncbi:MAG: hypothetical protein U0J65_10435 [Christensenellales bacterium]|nr:hypothetical protein [Christensenellales bacterium]
MIHLFPKRQKRMLILCACYIALVGVYLALNRAANPLPALLLAAAGLVIVVLSQYLTAMNMHSQLLARLYNQLDAEGFLREYEPKLQLPLKNANIALSVRLHTSNAYCALGRFDEAMELLSSFPLKQTGREENDLLSRFAIVSNLCYCAEQKNDLEAAQRYMDDLLALKGKLEALQTSKPEKKRMVFNTELNEQCLSLLTTGKADIEALKKLVQTNTQQLHKITISLWVARAYLADNQRREAEKLLEQIIKLAPNLYPGQAAKAMLAALPAKSGAETA